MNRILISLLAVGLQTGAMAGVNSLPALDNSKSPVLNAENEDSAAPVGAVGTLVSNLVDYASPTGQVDNVTDPDGPGLGIAVTAADASNGAWHYSINGGASWTPLGSPSPVNSRLLVADANTRLYFHPNANFSGTIAAAITFRAWDQSTGSNGGTADSTAPTSYSSATDTANLTITGVNDAPILDSSKSPALGAVSEDAATPVGAVGTLVSGLVDFASPAGQVDNVTDPDSGALLGIAVVSADTSNGTWFYSINGGANWSSLGTPSGSASRLLAADANTRLYFRPNADFNGSIPSIISFRAWDRSSGVNGTTADTSTNGGATPYSSSTDTASLTVTAVNDAPILDSSATPTLNAVIEDAPSPSGAVGTAVSNLVILPFRRDSWTT